MARMSYPSNYGACEKHGVRVLSCDLTLMSSVWTGSAIGWSETWTLDHGGLGAIVHGISACANLAVSLDQLGSEAVTCAKQECHVLRSRDNNSYILILNYGPTLYPHNA